MVGIHDLALFVASGLLLNIAPGPDSLLITTRSAGQGWRAGTAAVLGVASGTLVHIGAAALGLSALLAASATAFAVLKLLGAAYLVYLGLGLLLSKSRPVASARLSSGDRLSFARVYAQGFFTNVLNPKVALFFLAFVPQFIAPDAPHKPLAFLVLGLIFNFNGALWNEFLAVATALASARLRVSARVASAFNRVVGAVFVSLGIKLALSRAA